SIVRCFEFGSWTELKQRHRHAGVYLSIGMQRDWNAHEAIVQSDIKNLFPIRPPLRIEAAIGRYRSGLHQRTWKGLNVDFVSSGFVGLENNPTSIGGKPGIRLIGVGL